MFLCWNAHYIVWAKLCGGLRTSAVTSVTKSDCVAETKTFLTHPSPTALHGGTAPSHCAPIAATRCPCGIFKHWGSPDLNKTHTSTQTHGLVAFIIEIERGKWLSTCCLHGHVVLGESSVYGLQATTIAHQHQRIYTLEAALSDRPKSLWSWLRSWLGFGRSITDLYIFVLMVHRDNYSVWWWCEVNKHWHVFWIPSWSEFKWSELLCAVRLMIISKLPGLMSWYTFMILILCLYILTIILIIRNKL